MPNQLINDKIWETRISEANRYYQDWEGLFRCKILEKYYEGKQWEGDNPFENYTVNQIYETIQIQLAQHIPIDPRFILSPRPQFGDYDLELAALSSQIKQDVLNTLISDDDSHFVEELEMAYKDAKTRFGIIEVGYSADWIENPRAPRPLLNVDKNSEDTNQKPKVVSNEPKQVPTNERIYFKHIGATRFRVGGIDHKYLNYCSWVGYYEWVDRNDLLALKIMNRDKVSFPDNFSKRSETVSDYSEGSTNSDKVKIWHIWDNKAKLRLIVLDNPCVTLFQRKFERLPLFDFRPDRRLLTEGFYPIPPVFHWISPQNEINETREQLRNHRRRFIRKFQVVEQMVEDIEIEKFESDQDGALVKVKQANAIQPITDAPLSSSINQAIITSSEDINKLSGVSSASRGVTDRTTATQSQIIETRARLRESTEQQRVNKWICKIGREALLTARDKFTLGIWAEMTSDSASDVFGEVKANQAVYEFISAKQLNDPYDFKIRIDVSSLSAPVQEEAKREFLEFLTITSQFPQIALSPTLIREAAYRVGYRNEKVIKEMQRMALITSLGLSQQIKQQGPSGEQIAQQIVANQTPPTQEEVRNQLSRQLMQ